MLDFGVCGVGVGWNGVFIGVERIYMDFWDKLRYVGLGVCGVGVGWNGVFMGMEWIYMDFWDKLRYVGLGYVWGWSGMYIGVSMISVWAAETGWGMLGLSRVGEMCILEGLLFLGNGRLSGKRVGSQASCRVTRRLAWIQPVCIRINLFPTHLGLTRCLYLLT